MSNISRPGGGQGLPDRKDMLKKNPYGLPYASTETHRVTRTFMLPDGRIASHCDETIREAQGIEKEVPAVRSSDSEESQARSAIVALLTFFSMTFAYDSLSSASDHPLVIFAYWIVGFFVWALLK